MRLFPLILLFSAACAPSKKGTEATATHADADTAVDEVGDSDTDTDTDTDAPAGCHLVADPDSLDLGEVAGGDSTVATVTLSNEGSDDCEILNIHARDDEADLVIGTLSSSLLPPGSAATFTVSFVPYTAVRLATEVVVISSGASELSIAVVGEGVAPVVAIDPDGYSFGACAYGTEQAVDVTLSNTGNADLFVSAVRLDTGSADLSFDLDEAVNGALPWTLAPAESATLWVTYAPAESAGADSVLVVTSNDPAHPESWAEFTGSAY